MEETEWENMLGKVEKVLEEEVGEVATTTLPIILVEMELKDALFYSYPELIIAN